MPEKSIYIILTRTSTVLSRLIVHITGDRYTHASVALDKGLPVMYSFGRKWRYNPIIGGFCQENMDKGVFAGCRALPYVMVQVKVTPEQYDKAAAVIHGYVQNASQYRYNYAGLLLAGLGKSYKCSRGFYCSEFVYDLLWQIGIIPEQPPGAVRPQGLLRHGKIIREGNWRGSEKETVISKLAKLRFIIKALGYPA